MAPGHDGWAVLIERPKQAAHGDYVCNLAKKLAKPLRKNIAEAQKAEGISIKHDISVPVSRGAEFIAQADSAFRSVFPESASSPSVC